MEGDDSKLKLKFFYAVVFVTSWLYLIVHLSRSIPELNIPHSLDELRELSAILYYLLIRLDNKNGSGFRVFCLFCLFYSLKHTFGIPGALIFNMLGGILYGWWALPLTCILTGIGGAIGYMISVNFGSIIFGICIPRASLTSIRQKLEENREAMFAWVLSIKAVPVIPGWFANFAAPQVGIPFGIFFIATVIGMVIFNAGTIPFAFVCIEAGMTLTQLKTLADIFSLWFIIKFLLMMMGILLPVVFKDKFLKWARGERRQSEEEVDLTDMDLQKIL